MHMQTALHMTATQVVRASDRCCSTNQVLKTGVGWPQLCGRGMTRGATEAEKRGVRDWFVLQVVNRQGSLHVCCRVVEMRKKSHLYT